MSSAQSIQKQFDAMFNGFVVVMNPLAALRINEDAQLAPYDGDERAQVLEDLEHLSLCLWNFATLASTTELYERLVKLPDYGANELRLLSTYYDLFGLSVSDDKQNEVYDLGSFGLSSYRPIA